MDNRHFKRYFKFMRDSAELESAEETIIYMVIYSYKDMTYKGSQESFAKWTKSSVKTVRRALKRLQEKGLISIERLNKGQYGSFTQYKILREPIVTDKDVYEDSILDEYETWLGEQQ